MGGHLSNEIIVINTSLDVVLAIRAFSHVNALHVPSTRIYIT